MTSKINEENMIFICSIVKHLKLKKHLFVSAINSFKGLLHRFETFLKKKNVIFIDDSKATSFISSQLALSSLKNIY